MIERATELYLEYHALITQWYHAADPLTQYGVIIASGMLVFFVSVIMILSRITK